MNHFKEIIAKIMQEFDYLSCLAPFPSPYFLIKIKTCLKAHIFGSNFLSPHIPSPCGYATEHMAKKA